MLDAVLRHIRCTIAPPVASSLTKLNSNHHIPPLFEKGCLNYIQLYTIYSASLGQRVHGPGIPGGMSQDRLYSNILQSSYLSRSVNCHGWIAALRLMMFG